MRSTIKGLIEIGSNHLNWATKECFPVKHGSTHFLRPYGPFFKVLKCFGDSAYEIDLLREY